MNVGMIGLGTMGRNVALNILRARKVIEDAASVSLRVQGDWIKPWEVRHSKER